MKPSSSSSNGNQNPVLAEEVRKMKERFKPLLSVVDVDSEIDEEPASPIGRWDMDLLRH